MTVMEARRGRDTRGTLDTATGRFTPASPGRRHQIRCAENVRLRACWSTYRIVGYGRLG